MNGKIEKCNLLKMFSKNMQHNTGRSSVLFYSKPSNRIYTALMSKNYAGGQKTQLLENATEPKSWCYFLDVVKSNAFIRIINSLYTMLTNHRMQKYSNKTNQCNFQHFDQRDLLLKSVNVQMKAT